MHPAQGPGPPFAPEGQRFLNDTVVVRFAVPNGPVTPEMLEAGEVPTAR